MSTPLARLEPSLEREAGKIPVSAPQHSDSFEMVPLAAAGDPHAQRLLIERLSRRITSIALAILGNAADADDAAQAIFIEVLESLRNYREGNLVAWADRIAVRTAARHAHQRRVRGARDAQIDPEQIAWEPRLSEERRIPRPIVEYLAEIPETRRVALVLRHVMGYSVEEIAELTEVSPNTVKDRLLRAREQLRKNVRRELTLLPFRREGES
jgi:RNA polymerase sigma-70 factor (ECF subfamily)